MHPLTRERPRALLVALVPEEPAHFQDSLGIAYLKTYADSRLRGTADIRCLSLTLDRSRGFRRAVMRELSSFRPHVVGFSCHVWNLAEALDLAREASAAGARVVLGGPETYGDVAGLLKRSRADAAVVGEGEATFADLLERVQRGAAWEGAPGAACRVGERVLVGPAREPLKNLDDIPSPYLTGAFSPRQGGRWWPLETQRGCWFKCAYCATWSPRAPVRSFSLERVSRELAWLAERTSPEDRICLVDTDIFRQRARASSLLRLFQGSRAGVYLETNLTHWDDELMKALALTTSVMDLGVGVNAIDDSVCDLAGRPRIDRALLAAKIARLRELAPAAQVRLQFMIPMPGESVSHCREKVDWAFRQAVPLEFFQTMILPGTTFARDAKKLRLDHMRKPPYFLRATKECSRGDLRNLKRSLFLLDQCMSVSVARSLLRWLADRFFDGSILAAFEALYSKLPASRKRALRALGGERSDGCQLTTGRQTLPLDVTLALAWDGIAKIVWPGAATLGTRRLRRRRSLAYGGARLEFSGSSRGAVDLVIQEGRTTLERRHDAVLGVIEAPELKVSLDFSRKLLESEDGLVELSAIVAGVLKRFGRPEPAYSELRARLLGALSLSR